MPSDHRALDPRPRMITGPRLGRVHDRVLHVLAEVDAGAPADRALANAFRRARDLGASERAQVKEEIYGLLRHRRRAKDVLERALKALRKDPAIFDAPIRLRLELLTHLALEGTLTADLEARDRYAARRVPRLFERIAKGQLPPVKRSPLEETAIRVSMPTWLFRRLVDGLGEPEAERIASALIERAPVTLRVDETRVPRSTFLERLRASGLEAHETPIAPHGLILDARTDLRGFEEMANARVEVQDEGSQLAALALGAGPGETILDACAGAGGKTLALWSEMKGTGTVVAFEPDKKKADALRRRLRAAGADRIRIEPTEIEDLPDNLRGTFDRVLVDAPCTGTGTLRRHPDLKWRLKEGDVKEEAARQVRLLGAALVALKPGGILLYVTCSVLREENEAVVEDLIKTAPELSPIRLDSLWGASLSRALGASGAMCRIGPGPGPDGPDGFFIAALQLGH